MTQFPRGLLKLIVCSAIDRVGEDAYDQLSGILLASVGLAMTDSGLIMSDASPGMVGDEDRGDSGSGLDGAGA